MSDSDYQGPFRVFIFLLCLNLIFWLIIACWRLFSFIAIRTFSFNRLISRFRNSMINFRYYLQRRFFRRRITRITNLNNLNGISNRNLDLNSDLPPTYEEALKYPYANLSTICSNVVMNNSNATILNINGNDLDNLNLIRELEERRSSSILLCTGNCNCLNHLRQSMTDHNSVINHQSTYLSESPSTATSSTINSSNLNTSAATFTTTIIDETPTSTNQNLIVETNLTTFLTRPSNLNSDQSNNTNEKQEPNQISNKEQSNDRTTISNRQILDPSNLETIRNSQLNRSSTFSDIQSYLKNFNSR